MRHEIIFVINNDDVNIIIYHFLKCQYWSKEGGIQTKLKMTHNYTCNRSTSLVIFELVPAPTHGNIFNFLALDYCIRKNKDGKNKLFML